MGKTLNSNSIYSVLSNMIISQETFANPIGGLASDIVDENRVDGTLYGDTKLYNSVDMIFPGSWSGDSEAANLLSLKRNTEIKQDSITIDIFKMIWTTIDSMLTKQAFDNEGTFSNLNGVLISMIRDSKRAYDVTTYNTYLGNTAHAAKTHTITVPAGANEALVIAGGIANLLDDMAELSRDFNKNRFLRAFGKDSVDIIWNKKFLNAFRKVDLPAVFHNDVLETGKAMNSRYFTREVNTSGDVGAGKIINASDQYDYTKGTLVFATDMTVTLGSESRSFYAGEPVPITKKDGTTPLTVTVGASKDLAYTDVLVVRDDVVAIVIGKGAIPYMSGAESSTAFFNPRSLTENKYLIFGHNTIKALDEKPYVAVLKA